MAVSAYFDFDKSNPMCDKTPAMGMEGLVHTIENQKVLAKELVKLNKESKEKCPPVLDLVHLFKPIPGSMDRKVLPKPELRVGLIIASPNSPESTS